MRKSGMIAALVLLLPLVAGCQAWYGLTDSETHQYLSADPIADARDEAEKPTPKFLGWNGGSAEPFWIPGLRRDEVATYIDSGRFAAESFHFYHLDFIRSGSKEDYRLRAKQRYAERFNRELIDRLRQRTAGQND